MSAEDNPISRAWGKFTKAVPPWLLPVGLAATAGAGGYIFAPTIRSLINHGTAVLPFGGKQPPPTTIDEYYAQQEQKEAERSARKRLGVAAAGTAALVGLGLTVRPAQENFGLLDWNAPLVKEASLFSTPFSDMDMNSRISVNDARSLFNNDPFLAQDSYTRNLGTSIVSAAAIGTKTNNPTLGQVFDAASDKISTKLSFGGLMDTGVNALISHTKASLFTGALGSVLNLDNRTRDKLVNVGTWAGTIKSILN